jgi:hypothetical protein
MLVQFPDYQGLVGSVDAGQIKYIDDVKFGEGYFYYIVSCETAAYAVVSNGLYDLIIDRRGLLSYLKELDYE